MAEPVEQAELEKQMSDYLVAFNSGDYEKLASYWADDAVSFPPVGEVVRGRAALREFYRQLFAAMKPRLSDYTFESRFSGEFVFVAEGWKVTMNPPNQAPQEHRGRSIWTGRRSASGVWEAFWSLGRMEI